MKKSFLRICGALLCASFAAMSCNDLSLAGGLSVSQEKTDVKLERDEHIISWDTKNVSRTILPNDWTTETASKLKYVLTGYVTTKKTNPLSNDTAEAENRIFDYSDIVENSANPAKVRIPAGRYDLFLTAYQTKDDGGLPIPDFTKPVLQGKLPDFDLTTGNKKIGFYLSPIYKFTTDTTMNAPVSSTEDDATDSLGEGTGKTVITVPITAELEKAVYGLYTYDETSKTFTTVAGTTETEVSKDEIDTSANGILECSISEDVPAGHYWIKVSFFGKNDVSLGSFKEDIFIDGGNNSEKNFALSDIIAKTADNPTTLTVKSTYTNKILAKDDEIDSTFKATFTWDDNSDNEDGFELIILQDDDAGSYQTNLDDGTAGVITSVQYNDLIKADATITPYAKFNAENTADSGLTEAKSLITGSLKPSSTTCSVILETGHKYVAFIRAYNELDKAEEPVDNNKKAANTVTGANSFGIFTVKYNYALEETLTNLTTPDMPRPFSIIENQTDISEDNTTGYVKAYEYNKDDEQEPIYAGASGADKSIRIESNAKMNFLGWKDADGNVYNSIKDDDKNWIWFAADSYENLEVTGDWEAEHSVVARFISYNEASQVQISQSTKPGNALDGGTPGMQPVTITASNKLTNVEFLVVENKEGATEITEGIDTATTPGTLVWTTTGVSAGKVYAITISGDFEWNDQGHQQTKRLTETIYVTFTN